MKNLWMMEWALGLTDELPWPDQICDVPRTVQIMRAHSTMKELEQAARLRSRQELLDQADLIYRLHWCCVSARLKGCAAPQGLDEGVVMERHRALFWLAGWARPNGTMWAFPLEKKTHPNAMRSEVFLYEA